MADMTKERLKTIQSDAVFGFNNLSTDEIVQICGLALRGLETQWKPIQEAPKDGAVFIATNGEDTVTAAFDKEGMLQIVTPASDELFEKECHPWVPVLGRTLALYAFIPLPSLGEPGE